MILEIAHPNDLESWTQVDTISSLNELPDALASPSFAWFHGLVVRCRADQFIGYTGIFSETECVDVGCASRLMEDYYKPYHSSFQFMREQNLIDAWKNCPRASQLVQVFGSLMTRNQLARACYRIARLMKNYLNNDVFMMMALQYVVHFLEGTRRRDQVETIRGRVYDESFDSAGYAVAHALGVVCCDDDGVISYADESISAAERACAHHGASFQPLLKIFHEEVPFYDIAVNITRSSCPSSFA